MDRYDSQFLAQEIGCAIREAVPDITLRDLFAGCEQISRSIAYAILSQQHGEDTPPWPGKDELAKECFEQADAMLVAREKRDEWKQRAEKAEAKLETMLADTLRTRIAGLEEGLRAMRVQPDLHGESIVFVNDAQYLEEDTLNARIDVLLPKEGEGDG